MQYDLRRTPCLLSHGQVWSEMGGVLGGVRRKMAGEWHGPIWRALDNFPFHRDEIF